MPRTTNGQSIRRVLGATFCGVALWTFVSLSNSYETTIDMPLRVDLPGGLALVQPIPSSLRVVVTGTGWTLLKTMVRDNSQFVVRPSGHILDKDQTMGIGPHEMIARIKSYLPDAQQVSVYPDTLTLSVGKTSVKRVPLYSDVVINTRQGFKVIGPSTLNPDSVTIVGAQNVLQNIIVWPTQEGSLNDVHHSLSQWVTVSDSLRSVVTVQPRRVELNADVQEVGERLFTDIPLLNRVTVRDTSLRLVLSPGRIEVLLRGGVRDLSKLDPGSILAFLDVVEGTDTLGVAYPRLILPQGLDVSIVRVKPARIRYLFRREIER